jgi:DNA repair protein RadD
MGIRSATMAAGFWGRPDRPRIRLLDFRAMRKGSFLGFARIELPIGLREAGSRARHFDAKTLKDERRDAIAALALGECDLLTNCRLFSEGVDVPVLGAVILLRPTKSLALYLQTVGRALRPEPGKERPLIPDHAGNVGRHGLYDFTHTWSPEGNPHRSGEVVVRQCPECGALLPLGCRECPECGAVFERQSRILEESAGELGEVTPVSLEPRATPYRELLAWAGDDAERLRFAARARDYKRGRIWHVRWARQEMAP